MISFDIISNTHLTRDEYFYIITALMVYKSINDICRKKEQIGFPNELFIKITINFAASSWPTN